jgi:hypothetical protein
VAVGVVHALEVIEVEQQSELQVVVERVRLVGEALQNAAWLSSPVTPSRVACFVSARSWRSRSLSAAAAAWSGAMTTSVMGAVVVIGRSALRVETSRI